MKKQQRKRSSDEFKAEAIRLAEKTSATEAAAELGISAQQIYTWRASADKKTSQSARESKLAEENARLKRQLAKQSEELAIVKRAAYFARDQKKNGFVFWCRACRDF